MNKYREGWVGSEKQGTGGGRREKREEKKEKKKREKRQAVEGVVVYRLVNWTRRKFRLYPSLEISPRLVNMDC